MVVGIGIGGGVGSSSSSSSSTMRQREAGCVLFVQGLWLSCAGITGGLHCLLR